MNAIIVLRVVTVTLIAALITGSCWAQGQEGLWQALIALAKQPWGAVTLMDLSSGLLVAAAWIAVREPERGLLPLWWLGLLLLGNMVTLVFVLRCSLGAARVRDVFANRRALDT
jgi:hypothetical protein